MAISDAFKWVTVMRFNLEHEAGLCQSYLESNGIKVRLKNDLISRAHPGIGQATGGVQVMVADRDVVPASNLLQHAGYLDINPEVMPSFLERRIIPIAIVLVLLIILLATFFYFNEN